MLNTAQVALLVRPIADEEFRPVHRHIRHLVEKRVVPPTGPPTVGRGRELSYGPESTLLAAVAVSLSRWKIPPATIKLVIGALLKHEVKPDPKRKGQSGRLRLIIDGKADLLLVLQHVDVEKGQPRAIDHFFVPRAELSEFSRSDEFRAAGGSNMLVLDLPHLWATVSAFGFTPGSAAAVKAAVEAG